ncbi:MAG: alpha-amylase family glycosyl hydrolase [Pirellulaceae bacterium]|jgi:1,4-alpha-glucan branching enzyme|nr:alpha-amylase family glycosyl hydrolase [Pirellulaceae bacterium]MCU0978503.1 alpha-amylase family glycosyl hydrolase [Pirellulaceae bacterium]
MYEQFGAVIQGSSVEFRLFFPDRDADPRQYSNGGLPRIKKIQIVGDFQSRLGLRDWDVETAPYLALGPHPQGMLFSYRIPELAEGFYQYKYFVTFENQTTRWCTDPCAKYAATKFENAGFVIGGNRHPVRELAHRLPLKDLVIYEVMIADLTAGYRQDRSPLDAVWDKLDYLQELGVNAIEFMPWTAWRGSEFSWGYDPFLFFSVENRYVECPAEPLDRLVRLERLIDELHRRGLHVIMDGVFNHVSAGLNPDTGFPYHWLYQNPDESPFTGGFAKGGSYEDLDYSNECTQQFVVDACKYWLDTYKLDGIRFDYTTGFYRPGDNSRGIPRLISDLRSHLVSQGQHNVSLIIEHLTDDSYAAIADTNQIDADGCWYDRFLLDVPQYAASGNVAPSLMRVLDTNRGFAAGKAPVTYIENHDHSTAVNRMGGREQWWKTQPALIALLTSPGAVLLHNGQEFGEDYQLPETGRERVTPRPLRWDQAEDEIGWRLRALCRQLIRLRHECPSLRSPNFYPRTYDEKATHLSEQGYGVDADKDVVIYHRWGSDATGAMERFIVVLNFSAFEQFVTVPFSVNGVWDERLSGAKVLVRDFRLENHRVYPHWGCVFQRKE